MSTLSERRAGWQFSLGTLLVAIAWVAVTCVALRTANEAWAGAASIAAIGALLFAVLVIVYRTGRMRAFAVGFVVFGTGYLFVSSVDTPDVADAHCQLPTTRWAIGLYTLMHGNNVQTSTTTFPVTTAAVPALPRPPVALSPPPVGTTVQRVVMTTADSPPTVVSEDAYAPPLAAIPYVPPPPTAPVAYSYFTQTTTTTPIVHLATFLQVVHNSLILLLGVIGGIAAQMLDSTRPRPRSAPSSTGIESPLGANQAPASSGKQNEQCS